MNGRLLLLAVAGVLLAASIAALITLGGIKAQTTGTRHPSIGPLGPGTWTNAAPMLIYRSEMAAALLDGKIYVAGGLAGPNQNFTGTTYAFQVYDPALNSW